MSVDVDQLVHEHKTAVTTDEGTEFHLVPSLLEQLHDAIFGGMEATGGSSLKSRLPISAAAADLYLLIDRQIAEVWAAAFKRVPTTSKPQSLLSEWAAWVDPDAIVTITQENRYTTDYKADLLVAQWIVKIQDFLDPPRYAPIDAPCFVCNATSVDHWRDGENVPSKALVFRRDRLTGETLDARCLSCGTVWPRYQFRAFTEELSAAMSEAQRRLVE